MSFSTPGWTWTNTGTQSSTLNETVGQTMQSMPDLATGAAVAFTTQTALEQTTSATELGHSATVLRTSSGSSTQGNSWGGTSTAGTYSSPGLSGISMGAHALVPVGSDGLSYAFNNNPTNYVGDYLWTANDLLGGGSSAAPEAQGFTRNFGTTLTTQKTLAATAGASTTNSDNAASAGSNAGAYSSSGTTSYGTGNGGSSASAADAEAAAGALFGPAGLHFIKTTGMIIANGDTAAIKSLTNQVVSAIAKFIVCDGNSCHSEDTPIWQTVVGTPGSSQTTTGIEVVGYNRGTGVQMAGNAQQNPVTQAIEPTLDDATRKAREEMDAENERWLITNVLINWGGNIYGAGRDLATGRAGEALGNRAVAISENISGHEFTGSAGDYGRFAYNGVFADQVGINPAVETTYAIDISTGQKLHGMERWQRGLIAVAAISSSVAGPLKGGNLGNMKIPVPAVATRALAVVGKVLPKVAGPVGAAARAATAAIARSPVGRAIKAVATAANKGLDSLKTYVCMRTGGEGILGFGKGWCFIAGTPVMTDLGSVGIAQADYGGTEGGSEFAEQAGWLVVGLAALWGSQFLSERSLSDERRKQRGRVPILLD